MLPPEYLEAAGKDVEKMYEKLNQTITNDICRRIIKTGGVTATAEWQIRKAQEAGKLMDDIIRDVAEATGKTNADITKLFNEAGITAVQFDAQRAIEAGRNVTARLSPAMQQVLDANLQKTKGDMHNLTMTTAAAGQETFINAMNEAVMKVESGAFSYDKAIRDAVDEVIDTGAEVMYRNGRMSLESAARMNVLTSLSQTTGKISEMNCAELGAEYVEVSAHPGARPTHAVWQGKVYQLNGSSGDYENFYDATGYGEVTGLCGVYCRHSFYPFFPGISTPAYTEEMIEDYERPKYNYDGNLLTEYEASQKQRQYERNIRESRRKIEGLKTAIEECNDDAVRSELQKSLDRNKQTLKNRRNRLTDFCNQTGLEKDYSRTRIARSAAEGQKQATISVHLNTALGRSNADSLEKLIDNSPENNRMLWEKTATKRKVLDAEYKGRAHFDYENGGIKIDVAKDAAGNAFKAPYQTTVHEFAHEMDYKLFNGDARDSFFSYHYKNGLLGKVMDEEIEDMLYRIADRHYADGMQYMNMSSYVSAIRDAYGRGSPAHIKAREALQSLKYGKISEMDFISTPEIRSIITEGNLSMFRSSYAMELCDEIEKAYGSLQIGDISDMLEPRLGIAYPMGFGHGIPYWSEPENKTIEAFAEIFSMEVANPKALDAVKALFPKSYEVYQEILEEMLK